MSERFDARKYADKHGKIAFTKHGTGISTGHDFVITLWHNHNHSMAMGLTTKQAHTLLEQLQAALQEPEHE